MQDNHQTIIVGSEGKGIYSRNIIDHVLRLAFGNVNIVWRQTDSPHLIVRSGMFGQEGGLYTKEQVPYIVWSGEPFSVHPRNYPPIFTINTAIDGSRREVYIPFAAFGLAHVIEMHALKLSNFRRYTNLERPYLAAYCSSRCVSYRERMFQLLRTRDHTAHGLGSCSNTGYKIPGMWTNKALIETYYSYRFVLAMENCFKPGYITEKIINAFASGAIPIYFGDADSAKKLFNPDAFICVNDFSSLEACADYILEIDKNIELRAKMATASIFKKMIVPDCFRWDIHAPSPLYLDLATRIRAAVTL